MNAIAERFVGSARRELLGHVMLLGDEQLGSLLREYRDFFNDSRPPSLARPVEAGWRDKRSRRFETG